MRSSCLEAFVIPKKSLRRVRSHRVSQEKHFRRRDVALRGTSFFIARDFKPTGMIDTWRRRHLARTSGVQSAQVRVGPIWRPVQSSRESGWLGTGLVGQRDGAWSMKPGAPRLTAGRQHRRSWLLYRLSNLTGSGKGMRPPKMAAVSKIAPGLSLAASAELIFSLFLTVISDDCRARTRRHRRLDVGSGM